MGRKLLRSKVNVVSWNLIQLGTAFDGETLHLRRFVNFQERIRLWRHIKLWKILHSVGVLVVWFIEEHHACQAPGGVYFLMHSAVSLRARSLWLLTIH